MGSCQYQTKYGVCTRKSIRFLEVLGAQNSLLGRIITHNAELRSFETALRELNLKMQHVTDSVTTQKDCVRFK